MTSLGIWCLSKSSSRCAVRATKAFWSVTTLIIRRSGQPSAWMILSSRRRNSSVTRRRAKAEMPRPAPTRRLIVSGHHISMAERCVKPETQTMPLLGHGYQTLALAG